ncbi:MAG: hypothetical protein R3F40_09620 [Candidatus Competibacteraceae bacterium]
MVSGFGTPSLKCNVPIEVSSVSGVATPGAIGVVILYWTAAESGATAGSASFWPISISSDASLLCAFSSVTETPNRSAMASNHRRR